MFTMTFSNSLIIHQVKTKKIVSVKDVWIPGLNKHRFWRFYFFIYSLVFVSIEKTYQTLETVFHGLSKHLEFRQKYSAARRIFNSLLGVWISRWNTVSRVWYITSRIKSDASTPSESAVAPKSLQSRTVLNLARHMSGAAFGTGLRLF